MDFRGGIPKKLPDQDALSPCKIPDFHLDHLAKTKAAYFMANPKTKPETLEPIRNALMSDPSKMVFSHTDLTQGKGTPEERAANSKAYDDFIAPHISGDNIERNKVFHSVHLSTSTPKPSTKKVQATEKRSSIGPSRSKLMAHRASLKAQVDKLTKEQGPS